MRHKRSGRALLHHTVGKDAVCCMH